MELSWINRGQFCLPTIVAARLSQVVDPRKVITFGLIGFAASLWLTSQVTIDWGFGAFLGPQLLRGASVMLCIVPSVTLALSGFVGPELRAASGLFNLMRNLGGAIGIAVVNTWLQDNARIQAARMGEALGRAGAEATGVIGQLTAKMAQVTPDPAHAALLARGELARLVGRYALTSSFEEVFRTMAWMFFAALIMVPFCKPAPLPGAAPAQPVEAH